ncbi:aspartate carbamoyltransferase, partial [Candidatus Kaiserbacteria bacterium]|nr:aspartate carbamoyltransferase [Candidatus Kaiserbacteria bacterium]
MRHVIRSQQFDRKSLEKLFTLANELQQRSGESMRGKIMATLFYEPSTRTRLSFESAMQRLGGYVISTENAREHSSALKGETLEDTIRIINQYADIIVLRHFEAGASLRASQVSKVPIINAGDGPGQHPTQGLLDLFTIWRERGRIDGVHVVGVGDLRFGRTIRSLTYLLGKYDDVKITFVSPPELKMGDDIKAYLKRHNVSYEETADLNSVITKADVIYQTRIQKERFADVEEYDRLKGSYVITRVLADSMKAGSLLMHPLPRVDEIEPDVDVSPRSVYFKQAGYGVLVRMALLKTILGNSDPLPLPRLVTDSGNQ